MEVKGDGGDDSRAVGGLMGEICTRYYVLYVDHDGYFVVNNGQGKCYVDVHLSDNRKVIKVPELHTTWYRVYLDSGYLEKVARTDR